MNLNKAREENTMKSIVDAIYRLVDESMSLVENSITQLARLECGRRGGILKGPSYNIYVNLIRITDNLREIRRVASLLAEERQDEAYRHNIFISQKEAK